MASRRRARLARATGTTALAALAIALLISSLTGRASGADPACDRVAAPAGVDTAPGTVQQPFRTVARLAGALQPGQTGCLRGATYRGDVNITRGGTAAAPVRLQSFPGERAEIAGRLTVSVPAVEIARLNLTGGSTPGPSGPVIAASEVLIENNEITNGHTADCLLIGSPGRKVTGVIVRENDIHDCGRLPSTNRDNAISVEYASGTRIAANRIYDNADRGVQLFPDADGTRVASNVIDGNGEGVMIAGDDSATSDDNVVERNLVTNSVIRDNVESSWTGAEGTDNLVHENCFSGGIRDDGDGGIADLRTGFVLDANLVDDPLYADRAGKDFTLLPESPCHVLFGKEPAVSCTKVASTTGSDSAAGTAGSPYRTVDKLADALGPGQTGCLRAGTYDGNVRIDRGGRAGAPLTITSWPGERAAVKGRVVVADSANFVTISRLDLDGTNAGILPSPSVYGDNVSFVRNDVTNNHTAICFILGSNTYGRAVSTLIRFNRIHNCGVLPANNHDHGIYAEASDGAQIVDNWIYDNADRGIQLFPDAQDTYVARNVIDRNGQGVIFSRTSAGNVVEHNVIAHSRLRWNLEDFELTGTFNVARRNCIWTTRLDSYARNGGIQPSPDFAVAANLVADPNFIDRATHDYRLRLSSPCLDVYTSPFVMPGS